MKWGKPQRVRVLGFDLENRPSAYWYDGETTSEITAFGWKWLDEKRVRVLLLQPGGEFHDETGSAWEREAAYAWFREQLCQAGLVYGHNIRRHDLGMLNAALLRLKLSPLPPLRTQDTFKDLPKRQGLSYSLENLASMYGLGAKRPLSQPEWEAANRLTPKGVGLARKRVTSDVILQERLRKKLLELGLLKEPRVWRP